MKKNYCKSCKSHHFDYYSCSSCGLRFYGPTWPTYLTPIGLGCDGREYKYKYCPRCGHKFGEMR